MIMVLCVCCKGPVNMLFESFEVAAVQNYIRFDDERR